MADTVRPTIIETAQDAPDNSELNAARGERADISGVGALVELLAFLRMRRVCIRINAEETITCTGVPADLSDPGT